MKHLFLTLALIIGFSSLASNDPTTERLGKITGTVVDKNLQQPMPFVTIAIRSEDGEIITGGITDDEGQFAIDNLPYGTIKVSIQFIGYKTYDREVTLSRQAKSFEFGSIELTEDIAQLDEVTVIAERSTIEQKLDRKVINVGKDLTTSGPTASDIMNNIPSVSVDQQTGNISMRGNENVRVMVDGKLSNVPVAQLLKQLPSTSIKQIELITNPSAKYNPEGMSGIINIILHKNVNIGLNGDISAGIRFDENLSYNGSLNLNYRHGKMNVYGNFSNNTYKGFNSGEVFRDYDNIDQYIDMINEANSNLAKVGLDFYLNEKNTLSFFTNQNFFDGYTEGGIDLIYNDDNSLNQAQDFEMDNSNLSSQYNFNYKLDFNKEGHNLELETNYETFTNEEEANWMYTGASPIDDYTDLVDTERDRMTLNVDYVNPLTETSKLEAGLEANVLETTIDYRSDGQTYNANGDLVDTPNTEFIYSRDIYSAYLTYGKQLDKWSYQVGVRLENVEELADTNAVRSFTNDYFQLYPSGHLTYNPSEKNQFQLSYSRRVDRPGIDQVNPIREWNSPLISSFGNTDLQPQFTNSTEINYTRNMDKGSITAGVFYRNIEDEINRALYIDRTDLNKVILTYDNFDSTSAYGVELSSNYRPTKWWSINGSFELYSQLQTGIAESLPSIENPTVDDIIVDSYEVNNIGYSIRMFNNFKATDNLSFSAFAYYRGKARTLQFTMQPMYFMNLGARYNLWDGKGTLSVNYNDIFDSMESEFAGEFPYKQSGVFNWESNTINISFSYRFGGGKYRAKSRKQRDNREKEGGGGLF